jgi:ParB family chromosome partitioning protein
MGRENLLKSTNSISVQNNPATEQIIAMQLDRLQANPWNTKSKTRYCGREFDDLVASIKSKGLIQPIVARPIEKSDTDADHQIVCGERRYRACLAIAAKNGGPAKNTILTIVRNLSDEEAFDLTIIENLQRQDLNPLEEAESFRIFLERHGKDAAADLADRIGVSTSYVRRRVAVLDLPKCALKAWHKGHMTYGHLEQLKRLTDKNQIARFVGQIVERAASDSWRGMYTVRELKTDIDMESPNLDETVFDKKKEGCLQCPSNSSIQQKLFETDTEKNLKCLNPKCFKQKVNNHLSAAWKTDYKPKYQTNGFVFHSTVNYNEYETIGRIRAACKKCDKFVSIVDANGKPCHERACLRDTACYTKTYRSKASGGNDTPPTKAATRAKNHGIEFREKFYQTALPLHMNALPSDDEKILRATIMSFCVSNWEIRDFVSERLKLEKFAGLDKPAFCKSIFNLNAGQLRSILQEIAIHIIMHQADQQERRSLADHIGIDLSREWAITEEYLKKKTIPEIIAIANELGIVQDPAVLDYLQTTFKRDKLEKLKKAELIDMFLKSGADLAGKVPAELLN